MMDVETGGVKGIQANDAATRWPMKLFFATDLHGDETQYARMASVCAQVRPDLIVLGGDMYPDDSALVPKRMGQGQPEFVRTRFRDHVVGLRETPGVGAVYVIFGNHDWGSSVTATRELQSEGLLHVLELNRPATFDGIQFVGYSCTPPTPWFVKDFERLDRKGDQPPLLGGARWDARFCRPSTLSAKTLFGASKTMAEELAEFRPPADPWVFVAHAPPYGTKLDRYYGDLAWGSKSVRETIERHRPLLSLHGHIHESPEVTGEIVDRLGRTTAVNPGQSRSALLYAVVDVDSRAGQVRDVVRGRMK